MYAALRNPCSPCFKPQKATYAINYAASEVDGGGYVPTMHPSMAGSIKGSKASLIHDVSAQHIHS